MNIPDVLFGIATIWEALRNEGILYAYAGEEIFEETLPAEVDTGILDLEFGVVGGPNDFIMPILFPHPDAYCQATTSNQGKGKDGKKADKATTTNRNKAEGKSKRKSKSKDKDEDDKSPIGHLVLAVARRPSRDSNKFDIEIRDTRLRTVDREKIRQRAQTIATMSGWITGIDEFQRPRHLVDKSNNPMVPEFIEIDVPRQPEHTNACGLFVILFAWACMLGIPIHPDLHRRSRSNSTQALEDGLEIVNLALAGHVNARTIQAYPNFYGYSVTQNPNDPDDDVVMNVNTEWMNTDRFKRRLNHQRQSEMPGAPATGIPLDSPTTATAPTSNRSSTTISTNPSGSGTINGPTSIEPTMQVLMAIAPDGTTDAEVIQIFANANYNLTEAGAVLLQMRELTSL